MIDLRQGDCLELMKDIPSGSVDMILCDLPYGTTACKWDNVIPFEPLWEQYKRIIKDNGAIVLFGSEPFSSKLRMSNLKMYKYDWYWNKNSSGNFLCAKYMPLKIIENIIVFGNVKINYYPIKMSGFKNRTNEKPVKKTSDMINGIKSGAFYKTEKNKKGTERYPKNLLEYSTQGCECANSKRKHPTQKPVALLEYIIKTYTNENETVLDNCMGSGSTGVACVNTNRNFIGIELDEKYFNIAKERIENESKIKQLKIF